MPFDISTAVPLEKVDKKTFSKNKFDISTAMPLSQERELSFNDNSKTGASLRAYEPTWRDKVRTGLEDIGLRPSRVERIGRAQAQVSEAQQIAKKGQVTFDDALLTILSRDRADPIGALKTFGQVLLRVPRAIGGAVLKMHQGAEGASVVNKSWISDSLKNADKDLEKFSQDIFKRHKEKRILPGIPIKITDVGQLPESMAYSVTSMGTGIAVGAPVVLLPIPGSRVAAWSTGTVASGKAAFEMSTYEIMQEFLEAKNEESLEKFGIGLTAETEKQWKELFNDKAREFGLWEAIPEALSNLAFAGLLTAPLTKMVGTSMAARITSKLAGIYGEELLTETITEKGQAAIRREAGLEEIPKGEDKEITWSEAFKRIAPQTFLLTTVMAGTGAAVIKTKQVLTKSLKREIGATHPEFKNLADGIENIGVIPGEGFQGDGKVASTSQAFAQEKESEKIIPISEVTKEDIQKRITQKITPKEVTPKEVIPIETAEEVVVQKEVDKILKEVDTLIGVEDKIKKIQAKFQQQPAKLKQEIKTVQAEVIGLIEETKLEAKDKAKFLRAVKNVQTFKQLENNITPIIERLNKVKEQTQKRKAIIGFKQAVKKANVKKMRPEFREKLQPILDSVNVKTPSQAKISRLQSMLDFIEKEPDNQIPASKLRELRTLEKTPLSEFTSEQIQDLTDTINHLAKLSSLKDTIIFRRKVRDFVEIRNKAIDNVNTRAEQFPDAVSGLDTFQQQQETNLFTRIFGVDSVNAEFKTEKLDNKEGGEITEIVFKGIDQGTTEQFRFEQQAEDFFKKKLEGINIDSWSKAFQIKEKDIDKVPIKISGDRTVTMTKAERVAFVLHTLNERNTRHLEEGGFSFVGKETKITKLTPADIDVIVKSATAKELQVVNAISEYYNIVQKDEINKVSLDLIGFPLAREPNFSPIRTNALDRKKEILVKRGNFERVSVENAGWTQERTNAKNALILEDAFTALYKSIHSVSGYVGLAQPLRAAKSLLESNEFQKSVIDVGRKNYLNSLKNYIERVEGVITKMENVDILTQELINKLDSSILGLNPFVMLKQPVSYLLASTEIDLKHMNQNPFRNVTEVEKAEIRKWHPQLRDRLNGNVTTELGEVARVGRVKKFFTEKEVASVRTLKGIRNMDTRAIGAIWRAIKSEIKEQNPNLKGDALLEKVADRAWDVIRKTQPTFHIKDRSAIGMSKNVWIRLATKYSSQRNKNWIILRRAVDRYNRSNKNAAAKAKLTSAFTMVAVVNASMIALINLARGVVFSDKDNKELFSKFVFDFIQTNLGNIYFIGEAFSALVSKATRGTFAGFDVNSTVDTFINDGLNTASEFIRSIEFVITQEQFQKGKNAGEKKWHESSKKFTLGAMDLTGRLKGVNVKIIRNFLTMPFNIWKRFFGDIESTLRP